MGTIANGEGGERKDFRNPGGNRHVQVSVANASDLSLLYVGFAPTVRKALFP